MTALDWVLVVLCLGITLSGFWKGAVRLVFGGGGAIAGIWLALAAGGEAAAALEPLVGVGWLSAVLGRLLPLAGCVLGALAAGWGIERTLRAVRLGWLNRLCGAALAGGVALVLLGLLLATAARLSPAWNAWCAESALAPRLVRLWGLALESQEAAADVVSAASDAISR